MKVVWTANAIERLKEIDRYIAIDSPQAAVRLIDKIIERSESLEALPNSGRMVPEFSDALRRELLIGDYRLIYRINGEVISIETVWPGPRPLFNL